jgi:hypothetical protein
MIDPQQPTDSSEVPVTDGDAPAPRRRPRGRRRDQPAPLDGAASAQATDGSMSVDPSSEAVSASEGGAGTVLHAWLRCVNDAYGLAGVAVRQPDYNVSQACWDALVAAPDVDVSAGHALHAPDPAAPLYVPAAHDAHVLPAAPLYPASQTQLVSSPLPAAAREFAGHGLQFGLPSGDHCPSGHGRHVSLPIAP